MIHLPLRMLISREPGFPILFRRCHVQLFCISKLSSAAAGDEMHPIHVFHHPMSLRRQKEALLRTEAGDDECTSCQKPFFPWALLLLSQLSRFEARSRNQCRVSTKMDPALLREWRRCAWYSLSNQGKSSPRDAGVGEHKGLLGMTRERPSFPNTAGECRHKAVPLSHTCHL